MMGHGLSRLKGVGVVVCIVGVLYLNHLLCRKWPDVASTICVASGVVIGLLAALLIQSLTAAFSWLEVKIHLPKFHGWLVEHGLIRPKGENGVSYYRAMLQLLSAVVEPDEVEHASVSLLCNVSIGDLRNRADKEQLLVPLFEAWNSLANSGKATVTRFFCLTPKQVLGQGKALTGANTDDDIDWYEGLFNGAFQTVWCHTKQSGEIQGELKRRGPDTDYAIFTLKKGGDSVSLCAGYVEGRFQYLMSATDGARIEDRNSLVAKINTVAAAPSGDVRSDFGALVNKVEQWRQGLLLVRLARSLGLAPP